MLAGVRTEHCVSSALIGIQIGVETEQILSVVLHNNLIVCRPVLNQCAETKIRHLFAEKKEERVARIKPTTSWSLDRARYPRATTDVSKILQTLATWFLRQINISWFFFLSGEFYEPWHKSRALKVVVNKRLLRWDSKNEAEVSRERSRRKVIKDTRWRAWKDHRL